MSAPPILWITRDDVEPKKQFAMLNLSNFIYIDGVEETEEWPDGSKSRVWFAGGGITVPIPYRQMSDMIAEAVRKAWKAPIEIHEEERRHATEEQGKMLREVLRDFHAPNS